MKFLRDIILRCYTTFKNRFWDSIPEYTTINKTGIVFSDWRYLVPDNGNDPMWIYDTGNGRNKGWAVDVPQRNVVIIPRSCEPSTLGKGSKIFFKDKFGHRVERIIENIDSSPFKLNGKDIDPSSDVAICRLDQSIPTSIKLYELYENVEHGTKSVVFNRKLEHILLKIIPKQTSAWLWGEGLRRKLTSEHLGFPCFGWDQRRQMWKVITHITKLSTGEGINYSHPYIYSELKLRIKNIQCHGQSTVKT